MIYDLLAMCCGVISAVIRVSYNIFKALCITSLLFMMYFILKVHLIAIITALCILIMQIASLYMQDKIKVFFIGFDIALFTTCSVDSMRLGFLLEFVFWWHIAWFTLLLVVFKFLRK